MRYNWSLWILFLFLLSACEKEINLEHLRPNPKLVLNCLAVQGDTLSVELSRTWFYTDKEVENVYLPGADVKLYVNDVFRETLVETVVKHEKLDAIYYKSASYLPETGDRIRLTASLEGFKEVEAVTEVPYPCSVSDFAFRQKSVRDTSTWGEPSYIDVSLWDTVCFTLHDKPGEENYYLLYFRQKLVGGNEDDFAYSWTYYFRPDYKSEPLFATQNTILDQIFGYDDIGGYNGLAFSDELIDGKSYRFHIPWKVNRSYALGNNYNPYSYQCYLYTISRSYYNYMKTLNDLHRGGFIGDLAEIGFAAPVRIYSNVEGGTGILGGGCVKLWEFTDE